MADRLKQRHGEKVILWRYTEGDYKNIISDLQLEEFRIKKLNNIKSKELINIVEIIRETKVGAYQELLIDQYVQDIIN